MNRLKGSIVPRFGPSSANKHSMMGGEMRLLSNRTLLPGNNISIAMRLLNAHGQTEYYFYGPS